MKLYLYDFDDTIYDGNSVVDFFLFCYRKKLFKTSHFFRVTIMFIQYKIKYLSLEETKEYIFNFLEKVPNIDELVKEFWVTHEKNIKDFYLVKNHNDDVIISASPKFLLEPICKKLQVKKLIASDVDKKTGKYNKPTCRGEEKVKELKKCYPKARILEMYSDAIIDKPLLELAEKSYYVKKNKLYDYRTYKPNYFVRFWRWGWGIYHKDEEVWNYLIVGALTTIVSIGTYGIFSKIFHIHYITSNILSWIIAVIFAYFANRWIVFKSKDKDILKEGLRFTSLRIITLIIDTLLMVIFVSIIKMDDLLAKTIIQIIIVVSNYIASKLFVFNKGS